MLLLAQRTLIPCLLVAALSCARSGGPKGGAPDSIAAEALWALAPEGTFAAVVAAPGTGTMLLAAWREIEASAANMPEQIQPVMRQALGTLREELPAEVFDAEAHARMGLDIGRGAAVFVLEDTAVGVVPVRDRAAFREAFTGKLEEREGEKVDVFDWATCKELRGHYVCSGSPDALDAAGKSDALRKRIAERPRSMRGHIDIMMSVARLDDETVKLSTWFGGTSFVDLSVELARGGFTLRAHMQGKPEHAMVAELARVPRALGRGITQAAGLLSFRVPIGVLAGHLLGDEDLAEALPLDGVEINLQHDVIDNLTGEVVMHSAPGDGVSLTLELGLTQGKRLQPLVTWLCERGKEELPMISFERKDGACSVTVPSGMLGMLPVPQAWQSTPFIADITAKEEALVAAARTQSTGERPQMPVSAIGREVMEGAWNFSTWGYGSDLTIWDALLSAGLDDGKQAPIVLGLWFAAHLGEVAVGFGVRDDGAHALVHVSTHWANPDKVLRDYQALVARLIERDPKVHDELGALAGGAGDTLLGRTHRAGSGGSMLLAGSMGMIGGLAIPAFTRYTNQSKAAEARFLLQRLHDGARVHYHEHGSFPAQSVGPTPPPGTCCAQGGQCAPDPTLWSHPTWAALMFSVSDPFYYSYQYEFIEETGEFVVRAIGDLDCDGVYSTYELRGAVDEAGNFHRGELHVDNELE